MRISKIAGIVVAVWILSAAVSWGQGASCCGTWGQVATTGPSARSNTSVAYDSSRGRVVLFGGQNGSTVFGDTWEWDGTSWKQVATGGPGPRAAHALVYDGVHHRVLLFGGYDDHFTGRTGTWEWDGTTWTQVATAGPISRNYPAAAFDSGRGRVVLFGGQSTFPIGDTWEWDGTSWTQVATGGPAARTEAAMAYDAARGRVVLFGGQPKGGGQLADTWEWDGTTWTQVATTGPSARYGHAMAFADPCSQVLLFGGIGSQGEDGDLWGWNGAVWTQQAATGPAARYIHAMTFDGGRSRAVLFGGQTPNVTEGDTWELATGLPATYLAGLKDDFALPLDPASRRTLLNAGFPTAQWADFDDSDINHFVGQSFTNLPAGIVRAELEIRLRPSGGGSDNDAIDLGLNPPNGFAAGLRLSTLPGAGGTWNPASNPAGLTVTLDLANLPGGASLLAKVASERVLDVLVQDDTAVDYMQLRVWTCPPPQRFAGTKFSLAGQAVATEAGGHLVVSHLGTSGDDGIRLELGQAAGWSVGFTPVDGSAAGFALTSSLRGRVDGVDDRVIGTARLVGTGTGSTLSADFSSVGSPTSLVEFFNVDGDRLAGFRVANNTPVSLTGTSSGPEAMIWYCNRKRFPRFVDPIFVDSGNDYTYVKWPPPGLFFRAAKGAPVSGITAVRVTALAPNATRDFVSAGTITAKGLPSLTLTGASIQVDNAPGRALGHALLEAFGGALTASHLGGTGGDGLSFDLGRADSANFALAPLDTAGTLPQGAVLAASATGAIHGVPEQPLGSLQLTKGASGIGVSADFSALGSPTQHLVVLSQGSVVADLPGQHGTAITASTWPGRLGKLGGATECFVTTHPEGTSFRIGTATYTGDELRVLAEGAPAVDYKSGFAITAANLPELTVSDASVGTVCATSGARLCIGGRFQVESLWRTATASGMGQAVQITSDAGYFWFFDPANVELLVKALDGCPVNQAFWIFAGGLTDVEVETTVTDTLTGAVALYSSARGQAFQPVQDTNAFATCSAASFSTASSGSRPGLGAVPRAAPDLFLDRSRFKIGVTWKTATGMMGQGDAVALSDSAGYFWFFNSDNVELVVKVLNGCALNSRFWVFAAGLTDVFTQITVTDTKTGVTKTYSSPLGIAFQPLQDTGAFATCP